MNENFMKEGAAADNFNGAAHGYQHDGELAVQHCG